MSVLQLRDILLFGAPLIASSSFLASLHWFPWHGGTENLARTTAYALGTLVTVGVPAVAMVVAHALEIPQSELFWASLLATNSLVSGATVHICYWIDSKKPLTLEDVGNHAGN